MTLCKAIGRRLKNSPRKLNDVAKTIRRKTVAEAMECLQFSPRKSAKDVQKVLKSALANAENNHDMDIDSLLVKEAYVGKSLIMKRWRPRAKGRIGKIQKPFSHLTIILQEQE